MSTLDRVHRYACDCLPAPHESVLDPVCLALRRCIGDQHPDEPHSHFDRARDQDEKCRCGHVYYRHFDWMDNHRPGCKYCDCILFTSAILPQDQ